VNGSAAKWQKGRIPATLRQPKFVRDENTTLAEATLPRSKRIEDSVESRCFEAGILIGKNLQTIGGGESGHVP
jgi:hypothetical protein